MFIADFEQARATGWCVRNQIGFMAQTKRAPAIRAESGRGGEIEKHSRKKNRSVHDSTRVSTFPEV